MSFLPGLVFLPIFSTALAIADICVVVKLKYPSKPLHPSVVSRDTSKSPSYFEDEGPEHQLFPKLLLAMHVVCLILPVALLVPLLLYGTETWPSYMPMYGIYSNGLTTLLVLLRTLRWQRREGSSKFKDAFKIAFTTSASIIVVALVMLLAVATGFMLYFSHQYVQLLPLLSYLAPLIVCVIRVCIKMRKEDQPWWPIVFLLVLLVYGTLEVILLLLTLKPNIERNALAWGLSFFPPLCLVAWCLNLFWEKGNIEGSPADYNPDEHRRAASSNASEGDSILAPWTGPNGTNNSHRSGVQQHPMMFADLNQPYSLPALELARRSPSPSQTAQRVQSQGWI